MVSIGDINADGVDDVLIGAPYSNLFGNRYGSSYVIYGMENILFKSSFEQFIHESE